MSLVNIVPYRANDKYRATLRSTWIASPADTSLLVDAIPDNTPSIAVAGWNTDAETVFTFTGTSGDSPSNYALTGVTRLKGANQNLPSGTSVNCLNTEEFFNQYGETINDIIDAVNADFVTLTQTATLTNKRITKRVTTITSSATPTVNTDNCDAVTITALATAITSMTTNLSGTPTNFQPLLFRIKDDGTARAITWGASFEAKGTALPTTTVLGKVLYTMFIYDTVTSKWGCVFSQSEA